MKIQTLAVVVCVLAVGEPVPGQTARPVSSVTESRVDGGVQLKGLVAIEVNGAPFNKRFVIRVPAPARQWNGSLVIGAHGGGGGDNFDRAGKVIGTDETALDDVIGRHALAGGFAYASVDRDGGGNGPDGLQLTYQFTDMAKAEVERRMSLAEAPKGQRPRAYPAEAPEGRRRVARIYLVGLSAGGGIARLAAEDARKTYAGALIIAGAGGDLVTRLDRQTRMAGLWPLIDPRAHYGIATNDPKMLAYAEAVGTPVAARRLWPYTAAGAVAAAARPTTAVEHTTGALLVPAIEVVGTWDDLVIRELRAYAERATPRTRHRLYQVDGVWHMSSDDDGVMSFQYIATSRMKLDPDVANAMGEGPSYLPTVREAFDRLVRWVEQGVEAPASQTIKPGARLVMIGK